MPLSAKLLSNRETISEFSVRLFVRAASSTCFLSSADRRTFMSGGFVAMGIYLPRNGFDFKREF